MSKLKSKKGLIKRILMIGLFVIIGLIVLSLLINGYVFLRSCGHIENDMQKLDKPVDAIIVLGAGLSKDNTPSPFLQDRLDTAIKLYNQGVSDRILMSGDHGDEYHNEVRVMKEYAVAQGVPRAHVFMDHAGFTTYETMYRAGAIFNVKTCVVVTQKYHLFRAVYLARSLGLEAVGYPSDIHIMDEFRYIGYELREYLARIKSVWSSIFKPEPTYLGDPMPIKGDGGQTND
ncbi:MAG: ElyC/SanA/YdcF family protein [Eubacterium sp.]|nr:ElyC/SanA/YdcF family protein [Eubacterium sp.]